MLLHTKYFVCVFLLNPYVFIFGLFLFLQFCEALCNVDFEKGSIDKDFIIIIIIIINKGTEKIGHVSDL